MFDMMPSCSLQLFQLPRFLHACAFCYRAANLDMEHATIFVMMHSTMDDKTYRMAESNQFSPSTVECCCS